MTQLLDEDIASSTAEFISRYRKAAMSSFTEDMYLNKVLPGMSEEVHRSYPYQVRIPKDYMTMLAGDFEPAKVITVSEPIMGPYGEMWFADSTKGFQLMAGYKNGDSRFGCTKKLGDDDVHGILVGATGQGKSVTLNAFIYGGCYVYAPWELNLTLCDAKIVEFKGIAVNNPMPQISSVAATGDADYLISVLSDKAKEMALRNNVFVEADKKFGKSVKKIEEFREVTGLAMPQIIIIIDEFQTMFKGAGKKLNALLDNIYKFAKLGRNTGVHLLLASQEAGTDLPKEVMSNIKLRMAMGCFPDVSNAVLGNDGAAANLGKKGYMIMNSNTAAKDSRPFNVLYRVPFAPPNQIKEMSTNIIAKGKELGYGYVMKFFDEQVSVYDSGYRGFLSQFKVGRDRIYFGEPAFVLDDREQCLKINLTGKEIENIAVVANNDNCLSRYVKMFRANFEVAGGSQSVVLCTHAVIEETTGISKYAGNFYFEDKQYEGSMFFGIARTMVYKRKMMLEADTNIFRGQKVRNSVTDKLFEGATAGRGIADTELSRERFAQYIQILGSDATIRQGLNIEDSKAGVGGRTDLAVTCLQMCGDYGATDIQLTGANLPVLYFWIIGVDRVIGLGRSSKMKFREELAKNLQDSSEVNCRFLIFTTTFTDLNELLSGVKWFVLESIAQSEIAKIKCVDDYPGEVGSRLAVLWDSTDKTGNGCKKFKKMLHDGEIPV